MVKAGKAGWVRAPCLRIPPIVCWALPCLILGRTSQLCCTVWRRDSGSTAAVHSEWCGFAMCWPAGGWVVGVVCTRIYGGCSLLSLWYWVGAVCLFFSLFLFLRLNNSGFLLSHLPISSIISFSRVLVLSFNPDVPNTHLNLPTDQTCKYPSPLFHESRSFRTRVIYTHTYGEKF